MPTGRLYMGICPSSSFKFNHWSGSHLNSMSLSCCLFCCTSCNCLCSVYCSNSVLLTFSDCAGIPYLNDNALLSLFANKSQVFTLALPGFAIYHIYFYLNNCGELRRWKSGLNASVVIDLLPASWCNPLSKVPPDLHLDLFRHKGGFAPVADLFTRTPAYQA